MTTTVYQHNHYEITEAMLRHGGGFVRGLGAVVQAGRSGQPAAWMQEKPCAH